MQEDPNGPAQDNQPAYTPSPPQVPQFGIKKPAGGKKRLLFIVGGSILALLVAGALVWFFMLRKADTPKAASNTKTTASSQQSAAETPAVTDATPATFKSTKLNLEFTHRKDWIVTESSDKSEVIVTSPKVTYVKTDGVSAEGPFTLKIRAGTIPQAIQDTVIKAIAVRDSEIIAYDAPTDQQRQYTNLTDAGTDANTFNFLVISSSTSFKAGQALGYGVNLTGAAAYMFAGGYGADTGDTLAFDGVPKTAYSSASYEQAVAIIKSLKVF